jgi:hypothetical protein
MRGTLVLVLSARHLHVLADVVAEPHLHLLHPLGSQAHAVTDGLWRKFKKYVLKKFMNMSIKDSKRVARGGVNPGSFYFRILSHHSNAEPHRLPTRKVKPTLKPTLVE